MQQRRKSVLALCLFTAMAGCSTGPGEDVEQRDGLLFGLESEDVVYIHDNYVPEEPLELTTARLTAPFDCSLFDDLCEQVGKDAAIEFTAELVDLALDGATAEEVDAFNDEFLMAAMEAYEPEEDGITLRASGAWETDTSGNVRLQARNGVTTPVIGSRQAWTEAKTQRRNALGVWSARAATEICVDAGTNTQVLTVCGGGVPCSNSTLESFNPSRTCVSDENSHKSRTYHARHNGYEGSGFSSTYTVTARGSATAQINGANLSEFVTAFSRVF